MSQNQISTKTLNSLFNLHRGPTGCFVFLCHIVSISKFPASSKSLPVIGTPFSQTKWSYVPSFPEKSLCNDKVTWCGVFVPTHTCTRGQSGLREEFERGGGRDYKKKLTVPSGVWRHIDVNGAKCRRRPCWNPTHNHTPTPSPIN